MPRVRFAKLRGAIKGAEMDHAYVAEHLNRSAFYVSRRFCGHEPWSQDDQYAMMDLLRIPYDQMHIYFPKDGIAVQERPARPTFRIRTKLSETSLGSHL